MKFKSKQLEQHKRWNDDAIAIECVFRVTCQIKNKFNKFGSIRFHTRTAWNTIVDSVAAGPWRLSHVTRIEAKLDTVMAATQSHIHDIRMPIKRKHNPKYFFASIDRASKISLGSN